MRLIDADEIKKMFDPKTWQGEMMIAIAESIPTAYDLDKVVEQLYEKQNENRYIHRQDDWNNGIDQAIEIVKVGGI